MCKQCPTQTNPWVRTDANIVQQMIWALKEEYNDYKTINQVVLDVCEAVKVNTGSFIRRDYDGNVQACELVKRMIGEMLANGRINH